MKKILILGAGVYQVPLIKTAERLGIQTIVCSIPGNYPGFEFADKVYYENTTDYEKILEIAREEKIDGIVTAGTDVAVITIGKVCDELGLRGLSADAARIATDKLLMKEAYEKNGVRPAKFRKIPVDDENYADRIKELTLPVMFKSVDSSGSRGISKVDSPDGFEAARQYTLENTHSDYFIVEEYVEGEEFGAQAFVQDGKLEFILPHGDYVFKGDTGVPIGHFAPYDLDPAIIEDAREQLARAAKAMGLNNCAINADFILSNGKTYVLELGGRSGATCLAELVSIYYGFDFYEKIIRVAIGEKVDFTSPICAPDGSGGVPNASMLLRSEVSGIIVSQVNNNEPDPDICDVQFDRKIGSHVLKFHVGPHRIGHVITKGRTLDDAVALLHKALDNVHIEVKPDEEQ